MNIIDLRTQIDAINRFVSDFTVVAIEKWLSEQGKIELIQEKLPGGGALYKYTSLQNIEVFIVLEEGSVSLFDTKI